MARFLMGIIFILPGANLSLAEDQSNPPPQGRLMSFREVVDFALRNYPQIAAAETAVDIARTGLQIAKSERIPILFFSGGYNFFDRPNILLPATRAGNMSDTRFGDNFFRYNAALVLPLYTSGRITNQIELAELVRLLSENKLRQTKDELIFNLASTYYNILGLQQVIEARAKAVENLEETHRIIEQFVNVGKAPKLDLFRVDTRLANVRQDLVVAQNALDVTEGVLSTLMGLDIRQPVTPAETLQHVPFSTDLQAAIAEAVRKRPAYLARQREVEIAERRLRITEAALGPQVSLELNYFGVTAFDDKRPGPTFTGMVRATEALNDWRAGISVTIPIFNRGLRQRVQEAQLALAEARKNLEQTRLDIVLEVQTAYLNIIEAENRIRATETAIADARESLRIEQLKLSLGKGIVNDVLDAQADQLQAEENLAKALADYNIFIYSLKKAVGEIQV
jgi:outer membrane protein TolC